MSSTQEKVVYVHEFRFDLSDDQQWLLVILRDPDGSLSVLRVPMEIAAVWIGQQVAVLQKAGGAQAPSLEKRTNPSDKLSVSYPLEVKLSDQEIDPMVVMDYRVGALGFVVDRTTLTHVLSQLLTRYSTASPGSKNGD